MDSYEHNKNIQKLLDESLAGRVWRGSSKTAANTTANTPNRRNSIISTGYQTLDQQLHDGGWPLETTTELGLSQSGIGELRLLMPALKELQIRQKQAAQAANIIWIAPPFLPFAPALIKQHLDISQLSIVQTNNIQDTLWATEQALLAECCVAVLSWTGNYNLGIRELRRLQLAAEKSNTWNVLFRHSDCLKQSSSCGLRLHLKSNAYSQLDINILKQPQGWGGQHCSLSLQPHYENWQRLPAHLLPHQNQNQYQKKVAQKQATQTPEIALSKAEIALSQAETALSQISAKTEQINDSSNTDQRTASVTVLSSLAKLQTVH